MKLEIYRSGVKEFLLRHVKTRSVLNNDYVGEKLFFNREIIKKNWE